MTDFAAEDYTELVQDVESNTDHLPDLKVDGGLIFKRMGNPKIDDPNGSCGSRKA